MTVMYAASRDALAHIRSLAEDLIRQSEQSVVCLLYTSDAADE